MTTADSHRCPYPPTHAPTTASSFRGQRIGRHVGYWIRWGTRQVQVKNIAWPATRQLPGTPPRYNCTHAPAIQYTADGRGATAESHSAKPVLLQLTYYSRQLCTFVSMHSTQQEPSIISHARGAVNEHPASVQWSRVQTTVRAYEHNDAPRCEPKLKVAPPDEQ